LATLSREVAIVSDRNDRARSARKRLEPRPTSGYGWSGSVESNNNVRLLRRRGYSADARHRSVLRVSSPGGKPHDVHRDLDRVEVPWVERVITLLHDTLASSLSIATSCIGSANFMRVIVSELVRSRSA
jgi:hypothetical protein